MNVEIIAQKCDEIEGMLKRLTMETVKGKLNMSELALERFNDVVMKGLLSDIFDSGKSLGLKKRKKKGPADT